MNAQPVNVETRTPSPEQITVLDVGGTHLRWATWSPSAGLSDVRRRRSPSFACLPDATVSELQHRMVIAMSDVVPRDGVAGVSFGAALDQRTGTVYASAPLWGAHARPFNLLAALQQARPDVRWHVVNDVTAALLHLASSERAEQHRKVFLMTVSTGLGCRIMDRRRKAIPVDDCGLQGEVGHLPASVFIDGAPIELVCDCGEPAHMAAFSSGRGIPRLAKVLRQKRPQQWEKSRLGSELAAGNPFESAFRVALDADDEMAHTLLRAATGPVADLVRTTLCLDPEIDLVALTGGVATGLGQHYHNALLEHLKISGLYLTSEHAPRWVTDRIVVCGPGEANCLIGAGIAAVNAGDSIVVPQ